MNETSAAPKRILVAAGLIARDDGRVLITQRRADQSLPLKWELPGGKIEPGESPTQALIRELEEEIGARARIGQIWDVLHHCYGDCEVIMLVYRCELAPKERPRTLEVNDFTWLLPDEIADYDIPAADRPLVLRLIREGLPPMPQPCPER